MDVYTIQLAKWRLAEAKGIPLLNTTVKSGKKAFCPNWDWVIGHKTGTMSDFEYTEKYQSKMAFSLLNFLDDWNELLTSDAVALACYCSPGVFCHRHILRQIVKEECAKRGITYVDKGEIR